MIYTFSVGVNFVSNKYKDVFVFLTNHYSLVQIKYTHQTPIRLDLDSIQHPYIYNEMSSPSPSPWWNSPKRMELDCRVCGKAYGRGADQPSKCVQVFSSPIIHDLFNDSSWCNEQSYLGEKGLPSPGIEPKTFRFPCRRSNH